MMQIYLTHPRHGKKVAMQLLEADADKKNGWIEVTEDVYFNRVKEPKTEAPKLVNEVKVDRERDELVEQYKVKFDKAPHHRMSIESIRAALVEAA